MKKIIGKSMVSLLTMLFISGMVGTNVKAEQSFISEEVPDAVLDIWKTGVEYWGYTWNEYLSIDSVTYVHG